MYKVLQIAVANTRNGVTGYLLSHYRKMNRQRIQFGFVTYDREWDFAKEVERMGGGHHALPHPKLMNIVEYYKELKKLKIEFGYDAVHFNLSYANMVPVLLAKMVGFRRIIVHSHSTGIDSYSFVIRAGKGLLHYVGRQLILFLATDFCACSEMAAQWMFPTRLINQSQYTILHNAIEVRSFCFHREKRMMKRKELGISADDFVVGYIGRFTYPKNYRFLIQIFREIEKKNPRSVLLLVGDGPDREFAEKQVAVYGLTDKVQFLGKRADAADLYQAMDCFLLPSRFEGLPLVGIEAQAAGLPCFFSDTITKEVGITDLAHFISLETSPTEWAEEILKKSQIPRRDTSEEIAAAGYDIEKEIREIEEFYLG